MSMKQTLDAVRTPEYSRSELIGFIGVGVAIGALIGIYATVIAILLLSVAWGASRRDRLKHTKEARKGEK